MKPEIPQNFYRITIKALILDETKNKFLIGREDDGKWALLGGGLDWGESVEECLHRELKEEAGLEIVSYNPSATYFTPFQNDHDQWSINVVHEVIVKNLEFTPSKECEEIRFVSAEEVKDIPSYRSLKTFAKVFDPTIHKLALRGRKKKDN